MSGVRAFPVHLHLKHLTNPWPTKETHVIGIQQIRVSVDKREERGRKEEEWNKVRKANFLSELETSPTHLNCKGTLNYGGSLETNNRCCLFSLAQKNTCPLHSSISFLSLN